MTGACPAGIPTGSAGGTVPPAEGVLLAVRGLVKDFPVRRGLVRRAAATVRAVDGVSLDLMPAETLALVGESGCGKSTTTRLVLRLIEPTAGSVAFDGVDVLAARGEELRALRRSMQIVFQDPDASLDPRMTAGSAVAEPLLVHRKAARARGIEGRAGRRDRVLELLSLVGLSPEHHDRYPHELSAGQRQRVAVARALALAPRLLVLDEPVSALDVSVRAQVMRLLAELQERTGVAYLLVAHDLALVRHVADRVAVMYLGRIVETAPTEELFRRPLHPYTSALLAAIPVPDPAVERSRPRAAVRGEAPSAVSRPPGCAFHPRCLRARELCSRAAPPLAPASPGSARAVACHFPEEWEAPRPDRWARTPPIG